MLLTARILLAISLAFVGSNLLAAPATNHAANSTADQWRYVFHDGQWWYWLPEGRWVYWENNRWNVPTSGTICPCPEPLASGPFWSSYWGWPASGYGGDFYDRTSPCGGPWDTEDIGPFYGRAYSFGFGWYSCLRR